MDEVRAIRCSGKFRAVFRKYLILVWVSSYRFPFCRWHEGWSWLLYSFPARADPLFFLPAF
jgi:hypothetical protein